ncbi:MAG: hypothetical protein RL701_4135 [Pseudomonadota bacterium]|jgi:hypothetical protein
MTNDDTLFVELDDAALEVAAGGGGGILGALGDLLGLKLSDIQIANGLDLNILGISKPFQGGII